jgi:hypothetical protein
MTFFWHEFGTLCWKNSQFCSTVFKNFSTSKLNTSCEFWSVMHKVTLTARTCLWSDGLLEISSRLDWIKLEFVYLCCFPVNGCEAWRGDELGALKRGGGDAFRCNAVAWKVWERERELHTPLKGTKIERKNISHIPKLRVRLGNTDLLLGYLTTLNQLVRLCDDLAYFPGDCRK